MTSRAKGGRGLERLCHPGGLGIDVTRNTEWGMVAKTYAIDTEVRKLCVWGVSSGNGDRNGEFGDRVDKI